ncbi:CBS domain-containing protein [Leptothoe spongobia]|uniref:CBS domain-containing protein n=1 Tax=Leptothoe spongobia TAU-MAC 1115 TaxID=1967444 RepID=A0A947GJF4_9CYAN|nr:CBS domain-containing protein [Leptothoe spongobia]MBT9315913.1 CBS domain-containing protein [Leptothoe spongobia TAU-MAC 1115]
MLFVKDIMTKPVIVIRSSATVENAIWLMRTKRVRSLIVEEFYDQGPYGILTERDIVYNVIAKSRSPHFVRVDQIMRRPCICMPLEATLQEAAKIFSETGIHRAPVIENGQLLGIVSMTDILMKGHPGASSRDELSQRVNAALQHARIIDDEDAQIEQDCDIAWQMIEEMRRESVPQG